MHPPMEKAGMLMSVIVFMLPLSIAEMKVPCNSGGSEICNLLDFSNESEKREADADFKHKRFSLLSNISHKKSFE